VAKKRLQKLKVAGLIGERKRKAYEPAALSLTPKAFAVLNSQGLLAEYPQFLRNNPPIFTQVMLSTFDEVVAHPLDPIWASSRDYTANQGTDISLHIRLSACNTTQVHQWR